jgi:hypothetical protein
MGLLVLMGGANLRDDRIASNGRAAWNLGGISAVTSLDRAYFEHPTPHARAPSSRQRQRVMRRPAPALPEIETGHVLDFVAHDVGTSVGRLAGNAPAARLASLGRLGRPHSPARAL